MSQARELREPVVIALQETGTVRPTVEFLIMLALCVLAFRTFAAEAYIVPTGSMAPTLLGYHRDVTCPECRFRFALGMDETGRSARAICPNCGQTDLTDTSFVDCQGDRLLVQKYLFDLRPPRRWEVAVFTSPSEPNQAYVKRIVGLPGEAIQIHDGDIYVNGRIARKTLSEQRAMRILVHDGNFVPQHADRDRRWVSRGGRRIFGWGRPASAWQPEGAGFVRDPGEADDRGSVAVDWLEYRHHDPEHRRVGPVLDFTPYNGADAVGENPVHDLMLEAHLAVGPGVQDAALRLRGGLDVFEVAIPVDGRGVPRVTRNGRPVPVTGARSLLFSSPDLTRTVVLEASLIDRRLLVAIDGRLVFDPIDYDEGPVVSFGGSSSRPLALGVRGGEARVSELRVYRDVYYTSALTQAPRRPFGVEEPYQLGPDEYFMLGDNSPVSNDSRFWRDGPAVRRDLLVGKPFLVHLPSQGIPLQVFGRELYRIPDPREIRYIR